MDSGQTRRRQCSSKVKTGCHTCKIRRVKCDEAKPSCRRCLKTGRKCDGYASTRDVVLARADDRPTLDVAQTISTHLPGNPQERRGFQYFLVHTAPELSGYYTSAFWEHLLLQVSVAEPSLRHAVIAIGALHEEFAQKRIQSISALDLDSTGGRFATDQYSKAIAGLRRSLSSGKQSPLTALMTCILFVCFDSLRGQFKPAMVHLRSGLKILRDLRSYSAADDYTIERIMSPLAVRLTLQSILYIDAGGDSVRQAFATELLEASGEDIKVLDKFETIDDARDSVHAAIDKLFNCFYMMEGNKAMGKQRLEAFALFDKYNEQLAKWNVAFEEFMSSKSDSFTNREVRGAVLLKIHHITACIMAAATPDINDLRPASEVMNASSTFIGHTDDFQRVVNLARSLLAAAEQDTKQGKPPLTFSSDLGLIGPLYYTCVKCPVQSIRNASLELLKRCPRKEGMWDSVDVVRVIKEYWLIEDRHRALQNWVDYEISQAVPLSHVLNLRVNENGKWIWQWKFPQTYSTTSDHSEDTSWSEELGMQSLLGDFRGSC